jgi:hypothetical protein
VNNSNSQTETYQVYKQIVRHVNGSQVKSSQSQTSEVPRTQVRVRQVNNSQVRVKSEMDKY